MSVGDFGREFARPPRPVEERLPWLDPIEDEPDPRAGRGTAKVIVILLVLLVLTGIAVAAAYWFRPSAELAGPAGSPGLIRAPAGDYKILPDDPGGMDVEGQGDASYAASAGDDPVGRLDLGATPEAPIRPEPEAAAPPRQAAAAPVPAAPAPAAPAPTPAAAPAASGGAGMIQLGALPTSQAARDAWKALSGRFAVLQPFEPAITPVEVNGRTLHRLRVPTASVAQARALCARLKVAGESCIVVD